MNTVLRGEWGFDGFIVTDADACDTTTHCTFYMYAPRAVTTGTDLYDGVDNHTRADQLSAFSSDAYVVTAMRTAVQRALYAVANSAAMNGLGVNVVVAESSPWWQILIRVLLGVTAAMTIGSVVMWILQSKKQS